MWQFQLTSFLEVWSFQRITVIIEFSNLLKNVLGFEGGVSLIKSNAILQTIIYSSKIEYIPGIEPMKKVLSLLTTQTSHLSPLTSALPPTLHWFSINAGLNCSQHLSFFVWNSQSLQPKLFVFVCLRFNYCGPASVSCQPLSLMCLPFSVFYSFYIHYIQI